MEIPRVFATQQAGPTADPAYGSAPQIPTSGIRALGGAVEDYFAITKKVQDAARDVDVIEAMSTIEEEMARRRIAHLDDPDHETYADRIEADLEELKAQHIYSISDPVTRDKAAKQFRGLAKTVRKDSYAEALQMKIDKMQAVGTEILMATQKGILDAKDSEEVFHEQKRARGLAKGLLDKRVITDVRYRDEIAHADKAAYVWMDAQIENAPESMKAVFGNYAEGLVKEQFDAKYKKVWDSLPAAQKASLQEKAERLADQAATRRITERNRLRTETERDRTERHHVFSNDVYRRLGEGEDKQELRKQVLAFAKENPLFDPKTIIHDIDHPQAENTEVHDQMMVRIEGGELISRPQIEALKISPKQKAALLKRNTEKAAANSVTDADAFKTGNALIQTSLGRAIGPEVFAANMFSPNAKPSEAADLLGKAQTDYIKAMLQYGNRDQLNAMGRKGHDAAIAIAQTIINKYQQGWPEIFKKAEAPAGATPPAPGGTKSETENRLRTGQTNKDKNPDDTSTVKGLTDMARKGILGTVNEPKLPPVEPPAKKGKK